MLQTLYHILLVLIMINLVVIVHEYGHYLAAKLFKIKVNTIAIGLGKVICQSATTSKISWQLSMLPLGGYVSMLDSRDKSTPISQHPYCLDKQHAWKKIIVYLAGPAANIICTVLVYWVILSLGINYVIPEIEQVTPNSIAAAANLPSNALITGINNNAMTSWKDVNIALTNSLGDANSITIEAMTNNKLQQYKLNTTTWQIDSLNFDPVTSLGIMPYEPNTPALIIAIKPNGPAAMAGLKVNDKITAINNTKVASYRDLTTALKPLANAKITVSVLRGGKTLIIPVTAGSRFDSSWHRSGYIGIKSPPAIWPSAKIKQLKFSPNTAFTYALKNTYTIFLFNISVLTKIATNIIPLTSLSGPLGFIKVSMQALNNGAIIFFETFAIFNILLAFVNLLPMPGLDGGNILFISYEKVTKKELHILWQGLITKFSFIFLAMITIHATINDILRIIA